MKCSDFNQIIFKKIINFQQQQKSCCNTLRKYLFPLWMFKAPSPSSFCTGGRESPGKTFSCRNLKYKKKKKLSPHSYFLISIHLVSNNHFSIIWIQTYIPSINSLLPTNRVCLFKTEFIHLNIRIVSMVQGICSI